MALFRPDVTFRDFAYMAASSARVPMVRFASPSAAAAACLGLPGSGCLCSELSRTPRCRVAPRVCEPLLGRSRGRSARAAPLPTCWAVLLCSAKRDVPTRRRARSLIHASGTPFPTPRAPMDDSGGQSTRVTRTLEFGRVSRRRPRYVPKSLRFTFSIVDQTRSKHAARSARAPTLLAPRTSPLQHRIARLLSPSSASAVSAPRTTRQEHANSTPGAAGAARAHKSKSPRPHN